MNHFMYIACMFIWGLNFIAVKIQGTETSLEASLLYRSVIAFILFYVLLKISRIKINRKETSFLAVIGFGVCNFAVSYLLLYYGTIYSTAALVTLIFSLKAITTPIFIGIVFKTKIEGKIYIGGFLGLLSVVVILYPDLHEISSNVILGIGLAFLGTLITSIGDTLSTFNNKKGTEPIAANTIGMLSAVILIGAIALISGKDMHMPMTLNYWGGLLYLAIFASFVAWLFYLLLVKNVGAAESSYMVAMFPAIGGFASVLMGETAFTVNLVIGILLAMAGAYIALAKKRKSIA
ncbi:EamA-like transporter family protein [Planomicrobium soli]|uniref:EamA-like transporter family protein n=1 Tax=Planomicrobium soli TaxID=1176648 RepID=A0A2P8GQR1_9BACL|nr:DMT family transporter [Planomicrobium soli]PSL36298.1 EamA-like transporter family protein [Planomicrobium soli]